jgi:SAM-dependent methyltransferase
MKIKQLECALSSLSSFPDPKWALEQYVTPPALAARLLLAAAEDLDGRAVLDLGCGTGMLIGGACLLGAEVACGVDADEEALAVAAENMQELEVGPELVLGDVVAGLPLRAGGFAYRTGSYLGSYTVARGSLQPRIVLDSVLGLMIPDSWLPLGWSRRLRHGGDEPPVRDQEPGRGHGLLRARATGASALQQQQQPAASKPKGGASYTDGTHGLLPSQDLHP